MISVPAPVSGHSRIAPWQAEPYRLWSLWELMQPFNAAPILAFAKRLTMYESQAGSLTGPMNAADIQAVRDVLVSCDQLDQFFWLPATKNRHTRIAVDIEAAVPCTYEAMRYHLCVLNETLEDELSQRTVMFMPAARAIYYMKGPTALGDEVVKRFPDLATDIDEAGKCFACGRFTATVFHLMRVMEAGLQEFGRVLGVTFPDKKVWQVVLQEADKAIRQLDTKDPKTAPKSQVSANLYAVKLAWRNEVMHPKGTYTEEETAPLGEAVKAFMKALVDVC